MKKRYVISGLVILMIIAYIIGSTFPPAYFKFKIEPETLPRAERIKIFISIIAAFLTFCAVSVALFKEKILWFFSRPKLKVTLPSPVNHEHSIDQKQSNGSENTKATKYTSRLCIMNTGNVTATNVEVFMESVSYSQKDPKIPAPLHPAGESICGGKINKWLIFYQRVKN